MDENGNEYTRALYMEKYMSEEISRILTDFRKERKKYEQQHAKEEHEMQPKGGFTI